VRAGKEKNTTPKKTVSLKLLPHVKWCFMKKISAPLTLALLYLVFSVTWILVSDALAATAVENDTAALRQVQRFKGLFFVVLCSVLLYYVSKKLYGNVHRSLKRSKESLNRYHALTKATKEGIADHDLVTDEAHINEQLQDFFGIKTGAVSEFSSFLRRRTHPDDRERILRSFTDTINSTTDIWKSECRVMAHDHKYHDIIYSGYVIRHHINGAPLRFICAFQDTSELRQLQTSFYQKQLQQKQLLGVTIIKAQEEERNRWALELHDNICQLLTVAKLHLDELSGTFPENKAVPKTKEMVQRSLNEIRTLSASLRPPSFDTETLHEAIEELYGNIARVSNFTFTLQDEALKEDELTSDQKVMIYRIVQEQLTNITKYAGATAVTVALHNTPDQVLIEIKDNGKGFDKSNIKSGIGLLNIESRLHAFNGKCEVVSAPGQGCTLSGSFYI